MKGRSRRRSPSPIQYMGGKFRGRRQILAALPFVDELLSPFIGGGSIELSCNEDWGTAVFGYDNYLPLTNFWYHLINNQEELMKHVHDWYAKLTTNLFYRLRDSLYDEMGPESAEAAAAYFVLNRCSWGGGAFTAGAAKEFTRFDEASVKYLGDFNFEGLKIENADFEASLTRHPDMFAYLDPPYSHCRSLYGSLTHDPFNHERLAGLLKERNNWLMSYNDHPYISGVYEGHAALMPPWRYGNGKMGNELLILSKEYPGGTDKVREKMWRNFRVESRILSSTDENGAVGVTEEGD